MYLAQQASYAERARMGLGQASAGQVGLQVGSTVASAVTPKVAAVLASKGIFGVTSAAHMVPIVGSIAAGIIMGITAWMNRKGPRQKTATTEIVNQAEPKMRENLEAYLNGPRTLQAQAVHLAMFDDFWQFVLTNCGQKEMGAPGERCISERERGGEAPWCPTPDHRGCDWFTLYRDPIEFDEQVKADPLEQATQAGGILSFQTAEGGFNWKPLALAGALLGALALAGDS